MDNRAKLYISFVIAAGVAILAAAGLQWSGVPSSSYWTYFVLALLASIVKLRLPGLPGTYSLGFFFALFGLEHFTLLETLLASCGAALVQSFVNSRKRPTAIQLVFNVANLCVSVGACQGIRYVTGGSLALSFRPAQLVLMAACYFIVNTGLVSGVLSLLQGKSLASVTEEWYVWSFPYYLVGVGVLGLLPAPGWQFQPEAALILLPLLYLVHFYYSLSRVKHEQESDSASMPGLPFRAKLYIESVIGLGFTLLVYGIIHGALTNAGQFAAYLTLTVLASLCKIRLPRMDGTISLNFVMLLVAATSLGYLEVVVMSALAGTVQSVWRMRRRPQVIQVLFNAATLVIGASLAYCICQCAIPASAQRSLAILLPIATIALYSTNTLLVAAVLCLIERRPVSSIWQNCCFWSLPYYLVGAVIAGLMITTRQVAGWGPATAATPVLLLIYISYRAQLTRSQQA